MWESCQLLSKDNKEPVVLSRNAVIFNGQETEIFLKMDSSVQQWCKTVENTPGLTKLIV